MKSKLTSYANLLIQVGLNVQKGQTVIIDAPIQSAEFVRLCAEAAYDAGAREVIHEWSDDAMRRMKFLRGDDAIFDECPAWYADRYNTLARERAAFLSIYASDPDTLKGVDPEKIRRSSQARGSALQEYRNYTLGGKARWCVASVPITAWALKVFPDKQEAEAIDSLWDAIFKAMRLTGDADPVAIWREYADRIKARCEQLNAMNLVSLHYSNSLGTDLTVGLPEGAIWAGGAEKSPDDGVIFMPNLPTEEIFVAPHRKKINGVVVSSMPFSLAGNVIDRFSFALKDGKITEIHAGSPAEENVLRNAISVDEGASYFGEMALVPYDSPIRKLGILFYNTLFDENAACHFAFGVAYPCLEGSESMSKEELLARGINDSVTHQDFMVGTSDLSIVGTTKEGKQVPIFVDGNFAF